VLSIGYDGTVSGGASVSGFGPVMDAEVLGTAQINSDCTGKMSLKIRQKGTTTWTTAETDRFVAEISSSMFTQEVTLVITMVDLGKAMYPAVQGTWKRISPVPDAVSW